MLRTFGRSRQLAALAVGALLLLAPACGGGGGGPGPDGAGQGLVLNSFLQNGVGNLSLNQILEFRFSEAVDPATVTVASLQVREGPSFGKAVTGVLRVAGSTVFFEPQLPGNCDLSDAGFKPDTQYRVTLVGYPEQFSIKNTQNQPLRNTLNFEFHTRGDQDPQLFIDQIAATQPVVTQSTPQNGTPVVRVETTPGLKNELLVSFSENINPCTINDLTVLFHEFQRGDKTRFLVDGASGRSSGFSPIADSDPNPFSWGTIDAGETNLPPNQQRIRVIMALEQSFSGTLLRITPEFGRFPENALCVLELTFGIKDFGGNTLVPFTCAFTTENLATQNGTYQMRFEGETPVLTDSSTADVDTVRSPNRAQGWLLFAGDGDNGLNQLAPTLPNTPATACLVPRQANDGTKDDFDPSTDVNLDTGLTANTCTNATDGSTAVVWEFRTLRIRAGRTVRIIGVNPAILLVQSTALIENGGRLMARGDGINGTSTNQGANGTTTNGQNSAGGRGYAGGGNGGIGYGLGHGSNSSESGYSGFGSPSGFGVVGGTGAGIGGAHATKTDFAAGGNSNGGGGGGHSTAGGTGGSVARAGNPFKTAATGVGGGTYPAMGARMLTPEAGSGGGGSGYNDNTQSTFAGYDGSGGGGGAGGGFVDITASSSINIFGTVDAAGGRGGSGASGFYTAGGGAGGGSGGGIRLLTPTSINITGAVLTAAGGQAGAGVQPGGGGATLNAGGVGGQGRIVMEDGDSIITGQGAVATLVPNEGDPGFSRGIFDASRFKGGGLEPQLVTGVFFCGPANPTYTTPVVSDFIASIPAGSGRGVGKTSILVEARGYNLLPDGTYDALTPTGWYSLGYFTDSGVAGAPNWTLGSPPGADIPTLPPGNVGAGIANVNTREFLQVRITFYLPTTIGPFDPGPIVDDWTIRFQYDQ